MFWPEILPLGHLIVEKTLSASRETSPISDGLLSAIDLLDLLLGSVRLLSVIGRNNHSEGRVVYFCCCYVR